MPTPVRNDRARRRREIEQGRWRGEERKGKKENEVG
jgi:hypothetical protein